MRGLPASCLVYVILARSRWYLMLAVIRGNGYLLGKGSTVLDQCADGTPFGAYNGQPPHI